MRVLWLSALFGVPIIWIFHWSMVTFINNIQTTVARLVTFIHWTFLGMLAAVFAMQVLPVKDAPWIAIYVIGTLGVFLAAFGSHLHLNLLGWIERWPRGLGVGMAYLWILPGLWTLISRHNLFNADIFSRRGFWVVPTYNRPFHVAMILAVVLTGSLLVGLWAVWRHQGGHRRAKTLTGLFWGMAGLSACLLVMGALLPRTAPIWMPPYPYLIGMLWWAATIRWTVVRYELLPSHLQRYRALFTLSPVPIIMVERSGRIVDQNPAASTLFTGNYRSWADICAKSLPEDTWSRFRGAWAHRSPIEAWSLEWQKEDGNLRTLVVDGQYLSIGERTYCILALHDHTMQAKAHETLVRMVDQDPLTGVLNRRAFQRRLEEAIRDHDASWEQFAVFFVDCDDFKHFNDESGHLMGDMVLQEVAARLHAGLRPIDCVSRFGGDEFTVLVSNIRSVDEGLLVRDRILQRCMEPIMVEEGRSEVISISVGWSRYPDDGQNVEALLDAADRGMYRMKRRRQSMGENYLAPMSEVPEAPGSATPS